MKWVGWGGVTDLDLGVVAEEIDGVVGAMNEVENPRGKACFHGHFCKKERCTGVFFTRFEDVGVATGDGHGEHPQGDHHREIERTNARTHAQGLFV